MQYTESENIKVRIFKMDHNLDLSQIRCHIEYKTDDNEAVRERLSLYNGTHCTKVLDHVIFTTLFYGIFVY